MRMVLGTRKKKKWGGGIIPFTVVALMKIFLLFYLHLNARQ